MKKKRVLITGASGFIGHHLARFLLKRGFWVRGVDIRPQEYSVNFDEFSQLDLRKEQDAKKALKNIDHVYHLASDMGGMGFISQNHAKIFHSNSLIDLHTFNHAHKSGVKKLFYPSSACVYPESLQKETTLTPLKESNQLTLEPQGGYGMEKLLTEQLAQMYQQDYNFDIKIARFHNIYGPESFYDGGREKAPTALCRKVAQAKIDKTKQIEIWGDGKQTRSFLYIDDALAGIYSFMQSDYSHPLNIGSDRIVSINKLVDIIAKVANTKISKKHINGPQGVRGRNADITNAKKYINWQPKFSLEQGLKETYRWVEKEILRN